MNTWISSAALIMAVLAIIISLRQVRQASHILNLIKETAQETLSTLELNKSIEVYPQLKQFVWTLINQWSTIKSGAPLYNLRFALINRHIRSTDKLLTTNPAEIGINALDSVTMATVALELLNTTRHGDQYIASSYVGTHEFWENPLMSELRERNREKIIEGVMIKRVFIFDDEQEMNRSSTELISQVSDGINVRRTVTAPNDLKEDLAMVRLRQDNNNEKIIVAQFYLSHDRRSINRIQLYSTEPYIGDIGKKLNRLFSDEVSSQVSL